MIVLSILLSACFAMNCVATVNCAFPKLHGKPPKLTRLQKAAPRELRNGLRDSKKHEDTLNFWAEVHLPDDLHPGTFVAIIARALKQKVLTADALPWIHEQASRYPLTVNNVATLKKAALKATKAREKWSEIDESFRGAWGQFSVSLEGNNLKLTEREVRFFNPAKQLIRYDSHSQKPVFDQLFNVNLTPEEFTRITLALVQHTATTRSNWEKAHIAVLSVFVASTPIAVIKAVKGTSDRVRSLIGNLRAFSQNFNLTVTQIHRLQEEISYWNPYYAMEVNLAWGSKLHSRLAGGKRLGSKTKIGEVADDAIILPPLIFEKPKLTREQNEAPAELGRQLSIADRPELAWDPWVKKHLPDSLPPSSFVSIINRCFDLKVLTVEHLDWIREQSQGFALTLNDVVKLKKAILKSAQEFDQRAIEEAFALPWGRDHWPLEGEQLTLTDREKIVMGQLGSIWYSFDAILKNAKLSAEEFTRVYLALIQLNSEFLPRLKLFIDEARSRSVKYELNARQIQLVQQAIVDHFPAEADQYVSLPWGKGMFSRRDAKAAGFRDADPPKLEAPGGLEHLPEIQRLAQTLTDRSDSPSEKLTTAQQKVTAALEALREAHQTLTEEK